ncbi:MAG: hypothetical protein LC107_06260 [Chitinophagales bacterium]|nr:hypothetical protein [Chitinophagales bacterium]
MTGREIFEMYEKKRDYSGSPDDRYAQTLRMISMRSYLMNYEDAFYELLEKGFKIGKKIKVEYPKNILTEDLPYSWLKLV